MDIETIGKRSTVFTYYNHPDWILKIHLIRTNTYNFLIDTGFGPFSIEPVMACVKEDTKPFIVINTHSHWDHVWGNCVFKNNLIVSHKLCSDMLAENWQNDYHRNQKYALGTVEFYLPTLLFEKELYFAGEGIRLIHTPGHTIDSISVYDEADKILNAGDNIGDTMEKIVPELDCEKSVYAETLNLYKNLDFDTCVSAHNKILKKEIIHKLYL